MGKNFKNHKEYLEFKKKEKQNSDFAVKLVNQIEKELFHESLNEQNILEKVKELI